MEPWKQALLVCTSVTIHVISSDLNAEKDGEDGIKNG